MKIPDVKNLLKMSLPDENAGNRRRFYLLICERIATFAALNVKATK